MTKPLRFTVHARTAMMERELAEAWVEQTALSPDWETPDPQPGIVRRYRVIPERNGRVLRVACVETAGDIVCVPGSSCEEARMSPTVKYDRDADAAYIRFSPETVVESEEVAEGVVLDYDRDGRIVGLEVLHARRHLSPELLDQAA